MALLDIEDNKLEVLRLINDGSSFRQIESLTGISRDSISKFYNKKTYTDWWKINDKPIASGVLYDHHSTVKRFKEQRYILTSAQNSTYVHSKFLKSLEVMAERLSAKIIVGTYSYNKSGFQNLEKTNGEWFDNKIKKYIIDEPVLLADDLIWCGELNILPTAVNPLSGFHSYTKSRSGIIPHAKVQLESLPTHMTSNCRMLYTTGSVTQRNYIQKKAGQKASFHHIFGALIVEVDNDGDWFVRQLIADTESGEFYDLDTHYTPNGWISGHSVEAINWGDIHAEKSDESVYNASFGSNDSSMLNTLKPKFQFVHDVLDFEARNHHNIGDPYFRFKQHIIGKDSVEANIDDVVSVLEMMNRANCSTIVVESNHDLALQKWLKTADYKTDPQNAIFFLECQLRQYKAIRNQTTSFSIFEDTVKRKNPKLEDVKFLKTDESFEICRPEGIECGSHGHLGNNGAKGSINAYQKLGTRYNIGHSHSASIKDGVYQAGVSASLDQGYNAGASSWSHSHIVTYENGKRTIITLKNGKWRK